MARLNVLETQMLTAADEHVSLTDPDAHSMATSGRGSDVVGHGLGYTTFELAGLSGSAKDDDALATLSVTNTGGRPGSAVVQLYVGDIDASVPRPIRELKAFDKVFLNPGETRELTFTLPARAFAFFDEGSRSWRVEAGAFELSAGFSAADLRATARLELPDRILPL